MRSRTSVAASGRQLASACLAAVLFACPVAALAQEKVSLADLARQEQERRKGVKVAARVYTDKDVKQAPPRPAGEAVPVTPTAIPESPTPPGTSPKGDEPPAKEKDPAWWKNRITSAREEIRRNEMFAEALQTRVNSLTNDYVARDDPYQRMKIGEERQKALAEMDRLKRDIEKGKKQITDIEEEARRAGVPPGWLR